MPDLTKPRPIRVLLLARYAELLGCDTLDLDPATAGTVAQVLEQIRTLPGGDRLPPAPLVAVNLSQARSDLVLQPGDEVAILPPLAGG